VCHIIEKRDHEGEGATLAGQSGKEVAMMMPEVIAKGKLMPPRADKNGVKRSIDWNGYRAIIALKHDDERRPWLLSGFQRT
jgi:hypothetical protein